MYHEHITQYHPVKINMMEYADIISEFIEPKSILEIGSLNGSDVIQLKKIFNIDNDKIHIVEAHPELYKRIQNVIELRHNGMNVYNYAAASTTGPIEFNAIDLELQQNPGASSILDRSDKRVYNKTIVDGITIFDLFTNYNIDIDIDLCKIDVEGLTLEVLESFGSKIHNINSFHIECEHRAIWKNQKLYSEVESFLIKHDFLPLSLKFASYQSDSVWLRKTLNKRLWWQKYYRQ